MARGNTKAAEVHLSPAKLPRGVGINCVSLGMDADLAFGLSVLRQGDAPAEALAIFE